MKSAIVTAGCAYGIKPAKLFIPNLNSRLFYGHTHPAKKANFHAFAGQSVKFVSGCIKQVIAPANSLYFTPGLLSGITFANNIQK